MRKIICIVLLGIIALVSCKKEEGGNKTGEVKFTGGLLQIRVGGIDGTIWNAGDPVGIYMIKADPGTLATANVLVDNKEYLASAGTSAAFIAADDAPMIYPLDGSNVKFVAYHPYSSAITSSYFLPIDLSNQSNQSAVDVLYAPITTESYNSLSTGTAHLSFSHKLSKLVFNITNGGTVIEPVANGVTVTISGKQTVGTLNLTNGTVTSSGTINSITTQSVGTGTIVTAEAIVFPGSTSGVEVMFSNNSGRVFTTTVPNATWEEGNRYAYTVTLGGDGVDIIGTITPWDNSGNNYAVDGEEKIMPYYIDISGADFSDCYIYEIWDEINNIKIGELCKEYLHKLTGGTAVVQKQTIVAYPMLSNGKTDLSKGLVVETGHFIAWNPSPVLSAPADILASYTVGESVGSMPSMIYLTRMGERMTTIDPGSLPADRFDATLKPYIVRDQRSGPANNEGQTSEDYSYRVVKVGTQYWMADNLRTSRYRDGTNISTNNSASSATFAHASWKTCLVAGYYGGTGSSNINANNTSASVTTMRNEYGVQYTYYAIVDQVAASSATIFTTVPLEDKISPVGWTVPEKAQLELLRNYTSQSAATVVVVPALDIDGAGTYCNATGFSLRISRYRQGNALWTANATLLASIDAYRFVATESLVFDTHRTYCLRMSSGSNFNASSTVNIAENYFPCSATAHIRCIRQE